MKFVLVVWCAFMLCAPAAANSDVNQAVVAKNFVDALQHHRFKDAAALLAPEAMVNMGETERTLKRIDERLGGFATMHPVASLPDGKSIKLEIPARTNTPFKVQKYIQVRYASASSDGQPVFYELNLTAGHMPPKVLSFALHLPATDARSAERAHQVVSLIDR